MATATAAATAATHDNDGARGDGFLDRDTEAALVRSARAGSSSACADLLRAHEPRVRWIARRYAKASQPMEDLVQEGLLGLMGALQDYDPDRGLRFCTYARWWARAQIATHAFRNRHLVTHGSSRAYRRIAANLAKVEGQLAARDGDSPTVERLAEVLSATPREVGQVRAALREHEVSWDTGGLAQALQHDGPSPEETVQQREACAVRAQLLQCALAGLSPRERDILERRYLRERHERLSEVGADLGVSRERVRQLEVRALAKMRTILDARAGLEGVP